MVKRIVPVDYTSRDFDSIRNDLINYVKRYYPKTYKDFNQASFGSLTVDLVSYIGDILSFYLDYNANESFLNTSLEYENVLQHAKQLGYKYNPNRSSVGNIDIYLPVPAKEGYQVGPDISYLPKIIKGSTFSTEGGNVFTLNENLNFFATEIEVVGDEVSEADGSFTTYYILKGSAQVISGAERQVEVEIEEYKRFLKIEVPNKNITEIVRVIDTEGNEYFEVDYLSQNTVFKPIINLSDGDKYTPSIMKAFPVPRRFIVDREGDRTFIIFGYGSEQEIKENKISDSSQVALKISGKNYVSDVLFDPATLLTTDKFGVTPVNTSLFITFRSNTIDNVNTAVGTITTALDIQMDFDNEHNLDQSKINYIRSNLQAYNEEPINGDISVPTTEEIKKRSAALFATQGRAVTLRDYVSSVYAMPSEFGSIKRCAIYRDNDDFRRNLNMYIISENSFNKLEKSTSALKNNLKTWLNSIRMISDSIDILDTIIINLGVEFEVIAQDNINKNNVYSMVKQKLFEELTEIPPEIGEPFYISEVFKIIKNIDEVLDVVNVSITSISGTNYTDFQYDVDGNISPEGRMIHIPQNCIWELKFINDITGTVR